MAGTRLAAHTCFLLFSLISVLIAWRLGVVERTPLPLKTMGQLAASSSTGQRAPLQVPVDIDIVLLRGPSNRACPSCAAALDAMQANPSLARNAFLEAEGAAEPDAEDKQPIYSKQDGAAGHRQRSGATGTPLPLLNVREVNVRVVHAEHGLDAARSAPSASSDPAALDDWLLRHFLEPPLQQQQQQQQQRANATLDEPGSSPATAAATAASPNPPSPRYTFFVGCAGGGDAGELPAFVMGKRRHGYLGLGCACSPCGGDDGSSGGSSSGSSVSRGSSGVTDGDVGAAAVYVSKEGREVGPTVTDSGGLLASAAAVAVMQVLAGVVVANVLRSPVPAGDVHVRLGQAYRLNFSLLSEDPARRRCAWDFAGASRRYLRPMLRKLDPVASFAVQSQEVQYARLAQTTPRMFSARKHWYYTPEDLKGFLGANDFSTLDLAAGWGPDGGDTSVDGGATDAIADGNTDNPTWAISYPHSQVAVNFMVFCPSPDKSPLVFMKEWVGAGGRNRPMAEAYEVPGFGGVSVVNGEGGGAAGGDGDVDFLGLDRLRRALGAHASQLRRIIGLPRPSDRPSDVPWPWLPQQVSGKDYSTSSRSDSGGGGTDSNLCGPCPTYRVPMEGDDDPRLLLPLTFLPSPTDGVTDWEVDALIRAGMARNRDAAAETLRSLAALVESQPEMEVSAKIAEDVAAAIEALANAEAAILNTMEAAPISGAGPGPGARGRAAPQSVLSGRRDFLGRSGEGSDSTAFPSGSSGGGDGEDWACAGAMRWAREALRRAEAAYFDPTMVPQLYFPQDFLLAVYLPFLGPLAFPLLWGFAQELWRYLKKRKAKMDKAAEEAIQDAVACGKHSDGGEKIRNKGDAAVR